MIKWKCMRIQPRTTTDYVDKQNSKSVTVLALNDPRQVILFSDSAMLINCLLNAWPWGEVLLATTSCSCSSSSLSSSSLPSSSSSSSLLLAGWTAICMELSGQLPQHLFKTNLSHSGHTHYPHPQNPSKQISHPHFNLGRQAELILK